MDAMIVIGKPAPDFTLADLKGGQHSLSGCRGKIVILSFWSAECAWAESADQAPETMPADWQGRVTRLTIACNRDEPRELLRQVAQERRLAPLLLDPGQQVVHLYQVQTTPHFFVIDADGILRYRGAGDNRTFRQRIPTRNYLYEAIEALLTGKDPEITETPAYGCAIVQY